MPFDVTVERAIAADPAAVRAYMFAPAHDPEWITGIRSVEAPSGPLAAGTRVPRVAAFMGRRVAYELEVAALEDGLLDMRSTAAPFPMRVTYSVAPAPGGVGSRVAIRVRGGPGGLLALLGPLTRWQIRRNLARDLQRLAARVEPATAP
jgi:carbon monoxide dehydrogenase subunit G